MRVRHRIVLNPNLLTSGSDASTQLDCTQPQPPALQFLTFSAPLGQLVGDELVAPLNQVRPTCKLLTCSLA